MLVIDRDGVAAGATGLGTAAACLVRVETERPDKIPSGVGDVLGQLGDEIQGIEDLEGAGDAAEEVGAGGPGEAPGRRLLGQVEHLALWRDADQALQAEGTGEHVVQQALAAREVVGRTCTAVPECCQPAIWPDERLVDLFALQQQAEDLACR